MFTFYIETFNSPKIHFGVCYEAGIHCVPVVQIPFIKSTLSYFWHRHHILFIDSLYAVPLIYLFIHQYHCYNLYYIVICFNNWSGNHFISLHYQNFILNSEESFRWTLESFCQVKKIIIIFCCNYGHLFNIHSTPFYCVSRVLGMNSVKCKFIWREPITTKFSHTRIGLFLDSFKSLFISLSRVYSRIHTGPIPFLLFSCITYFLSLCECDLFHHIL